MSTFSSFPSKPHSNIDVDSSDELTEQSALANMEERLREEFRLMMQATHKRLHSLEKRLGTLEEQHGIVSDEQSENQNSLEERVSAIEGILKKAEEAGRRRQQYRRTQSDDGLAGVTPTLTRDRSRSRMTRSDSGKQATLRGMVRSDSGKQVRGLERQASARGLKRSDSGKLASEMRINPNFDAAGNPVNC